YLLSAIAFALATLTKGPIAVILPGTVLAVYLFAVKDLKALKKMPIFSIILVYLVVTAPWYLLMYRLHGKDFIDAFFGFHNITRFLESEHKIGSQFYYNIPIVFGGFFPWSIFIPVGLWHVFKTQKAKLKSQNEKKHSIFILLWFFVIFIFFSISKTKLPTYIFPSFISLALIVAVYWDDFLRGNISLKIMKAMSSSYYLLLVTVILGTIGALIFTRLRYPTVLPGSLIAGLFLIFGAALSLAAFINKKFIGSFFLVVYLVVIFLYPFNTLVLPEIERYETSKEISKKLSLLMKAGERLGSESQYLAGTAFYTGKVPIDLDKHDILVKFLSLDERVWCVLKEKNHIQLYTLETKPHLKKPSYLVYKVGKRAIITNIVPDDGVFLIKRERLK
ncbi:MAG: hypothetical protein HZA30_01345, partial [Candidatus Omnitrophica bacterium]|nr:hypothetical protein [Candidatus Omnitrophota bacterium]